MKYNREQLVDIAHIILTGAMDRIECQLPDMQGSSGIALRKDINANVAWIIETAYMQLSILFANQTGDGLSPTEIAGRDEFEDRVYKLINYRYSVDFKGLKNGESCSPDCKDLAEKFADICNPEDELDLFTDEDFELTAKEVQKQTRMLAPSIDGLKNAIRAGMKAYQNGDPITSNPYVAENDYLAAGWQEGYFRPMPPTSTEGGKKW